ncbi:hypothetical protein L228DRAFT_217562 [Xylona heveae TC161]|uniref:ATPase n=1 Tax=Xylona heveae (strain CBS 132557 / TC161) TaxID=1328760 RepID=A0A165IPI5_XYLHT|nr:hypothetical protein L228DRAFT_217562 [Xylona heveae TC161]KZF25193.1 hypothetical protein L228DRAFT_217562 [Xylona heveae TC161]
MSGRGAARGRGAYYKALYGGRGRGRDGSNQHSVEPPQPRHAPGTLSDWNTLSQLLRNVDGQQYGQYKRLAGTYRHASPNFTLCVDHVQSDAYAPPSRVRAIMSLSDTGFPVDVFDNEIRQIALGDYVTRTAAEFIRSRHMDQAVPSGAGAGGWAGPKGGAFNINAPGQEVLPRTSCLVKMQKAQRPPPEGTIELRFTVALPARGRTILGHEAHRILAVNLPELIRQTLQWGKQSQQKLLQHVRSVEDQEDMRCQLVQKGLVTFIANGSILPRASGASSMPMRSSSVVPFQSPPDMEVELHRPNGGLIRGMGIQHGITVLSGGGFHGKSTLLEAIELGIYNHIPGDGREGVVTDPTAIKIRAEDGRSVSGVDISPFISGLPGKKNTSCFSSEDASGSTSMASNIQEALELGSKTLLIDEDSSATNLLVRDQRMQALVRNEPITPLVSKVRALYNQHGVSTLIVIGGCGDYLSVADVVLGLSSYKVENLTARAAEVAANYPANIPQHQKYGTISSRKVTLPSSIAIGRPPSSKGRSFIMLPSDAPAGPKNPAAEDPGIDIAALSQLVEPGQAALAAQVVRWAARRPDSTAVATSLFDTLDEMERLVRKGGLDALHSEGWMVGDMVWARRFELGAVIARIRGLTVH